MQAVLWSTLGVSCCPAPIRPALLDKSAGCYDLAAVEESFVLAFAKSGDSDPNHLNVALNRAYRVSDFMRRATLVCILFHVFSNS